MEVHASHSTNTILNMYEQMKLLLPLNVQNIDISKLEKLLM